MNPIIWTEKNDLARADTPDEAAQQKRAVNYTRPTEQREITKAELKGILIQQLAGDFIENLLIFSRIYNLVLNFY